MNKVQRKRERVGPGVDQFQEMYCLNGFKSKHYTDLRREKINIEK